MSTSVNPSAAPLEAPKPSGPQAAVPAPQKKGGRKVWLLAALLIVAGSAAWYLFRPAPQKIAPAAATRTAVIRAGALQQTMRITGTTVAGNYANIAAPLLRSPEGGRGLTLLNLAKPGSWVKKGDVVAEIDSQSARDHIDDVKDMVAAAEADIRKRRAEHAIELENLRQAVTVAQSRLDKARLEAGASEIRTAVDQELLKLSVEEYEATHKGAQADLQVKLAGHKSDLRLLDIAKIRQDRHLERHEIDMRNMTIRTPMEGLVVMMSIYRGGDMAQVQVGDQMAPNQPFMKIVDPNSMRLEAMVNQVESEHLRVSQPVVASFDAFPGVTLTGKIDSIGAIAIGGHRQQFYIRNIPVKVALTQQDPRIIPDLSAAADVVIHQEQDRPLLPLEGVFREGGKTVAFVKKQPGGFEARAVELGPRNNTHAAVLSGLKPGDVVALERPARASM